MTIQLPAWLDWLPIPSGQETELPPRVLALPLEVPALRTRSTQAQKSLGKIAGPPDAWQGFKAHPIELLRDMERYLKRLNSEKVAPKRRLEWMDRTLQFACQAIRGIYSLHHKDDALPESHDRREGLSVVIAVCGQLAGGYKHLLKHDYDLPDRRYLAVRERVRHCAMRIFELIQVEQRFRALRYQKLPPTVWLDANRIFFALRQCEDMQKAIPSVASLQLHLDRRPDDMARRAPLTANLQQAYLSIQLFGLMDTNTLSSRNMHVVDVQVNLALPNLKVADDMGIPLPTGQVIVYSNQDRPPFFQRQDEKAEAALVHEREMLREKGEAIPELMAPLAITVDLGPLEDQLIAEHHRLVKVFAHEKKEDASVVVGDHMDLARLLVVDDMCDKLKIKTRQDKRVNVLGQNILYVYNGFMSVYRLLLEAMEDQDEAEALSQDHGLRDALAARSSLIALDDEASTMGQWFVMDVSKGGVQIKTRESQFTTPLFIGQLVAFGFSREELKKPTLGYVLRLARDSVGNIEVTLRILAQKVRATAVQSAFLSANEMALPGMILEGANPENPLEKRLVIHQSHRLAQGMPIKLGVEGQQKPSLVEDVLNMQREFVLYSLHADDTPPEKLRKPSVKSRVRKKKLT